MGLTKEKLKYKQLKIKKITHCYFICIIKVADEEYIRKIRVGKI